MDFKKITGIVDDKRIDVIPGIRVLAIFLIAWFHIWQQSWLCPVFIAGTRYIDLTYIPATGYLWVDMFILLSAFQLALPYIHKMFNGENFQRPIDFYKKRMIRIMPSYYFNILVCFIIALVLGEFFTPRMMYIDILTHLTFTQTFKDFTYLWTNLNVVLWTVAVLVQFYLLFPFIIRAYKKIPVISFSIMVFIGILFRALYVNNSLDPSLMTNQMPAFFDVLAIGILGAYLVVAINKYLPYEKYSIGFTFLSVLSFAGILSYMREVRGIIGQVNIQRWQGSNRLELAVLFMVFLISTIYAVKQYRWIFSNKLMVYLASVSYNYYIWHQYIAVRLKQWNIPPSLSEMPNMTGEQPWQWIYTIISFLIPLAIAILLTYLLDKVLIGLLVKKKNNELSV